MDIIKKIRMACAYADVNDSELARRFGSSPQAFFQRMRTGKFTSDELDKIAECLGAEHIEYFQFPDGHTEGK